MPRQSSPYPRSTRSHRSYQDRRSRHSPSRDRAPRPHHHHHHSCIHYVRNCPMTQDKVDELFRELYYQKHDLIRLNANLRDVLKLVEKLQKVRLFLPLI